MNTNQTALPNRVGRAALVALLLLALVLRAAMLWGLGGSLAQDRDNYRRIAEHVAAGEGFVDPQTGFPTAYRPPLYPLLVAAVLVSGFGNMAIGIVQLMLGVGAVILTMLCARRLGLGRRSLVAALLVAVDPLLLQQTALVMTETTSAFLAALVLWLGAGRPSRLRNIALGAAFGLCCLCRPTFWVFGALAVTIWAVVRIRATNSASSPSRNHWRQGVGIAAGVAAGVVLVVAPWGIRNAIVMGRPIITTTHGGYTLLLAHNMPYTCAVVEQPWGAVWEAASLNEWQASLEAEMARATPPIDAAHLSPAVELARDTWMNRKAREYICNEPFVALKSGMTLVGRLWNVVPLATKNTPLPNSVRWAIGGFYAVVLVAMLRGVCRLSRDDRLKWWPLLALIAGFTVVHSLYWADMRMRAPLIPAIALLAAYRPGRDSDFLT